MIRNLAYLQIFPWEADHKTLGFSLMHNKYKPVIYPLVSEMVTRKKLNRAYNKNKSHCLKYTLSGG